MFCVRLSKIHLWDTVTFSILVYRNSINKWMIFVIVFFSFVLPTKSQNDCALSGLKNLFYFRFRLFWKYHNFVFVLLIKFNGIVFFQALVYFSNVFCLGYNRIVILFWCSSLGLKENNLTEQLFLLIESLITSKLSLDFCRFRCKFWIFNLIFYYFPIIATPSFSIKV